MPSMDDFLKPESMLTPGIAGGVTMMASNALRLSFGLPCKWTALTISFAFGLVILLRQRGPWPARILYCVLNSLIIFSVGSGTNQVVSAAGPRPSAAPPQLAEARQAVGKVRQAIMQPLETVTARAGRAQVALDRQALASKQAQREAEEAKQLYDITARQLNELQRDEALLVNRLNVHGGVTMTPEDTVKTPGGAKKIVLAKKIAGEVKKAPAGEVKKAPAGELTEFLSEWAAVRKRIAKATESRDAAAKAQWKSELAFKAAQEQMSKARDYLAECQEDSAGLQRETEHARTVLAQAEEALERIRKADEEKRWFFSPWW